MSSGYKRLLCYKRFLLDLKVIDTSNTQIEREREEEWRNFWTNMRREKQVGRSVGQIGRAHV